MEPDQAFNSSVFFMMNASWDMNNLTFYPRQKSLAMDLEILQKVVPILVPILFSIIIITGFIGNLLVVCVVTLNKNMMNTTNLLILNLAVRKMSCEALQMLYIIKLLFLEYCIVIVSLRIFFYGFICYIFTEKDGKSACVSFVWVFGRFH